MAIWTNPTTRTTDERISQSIWNTDLVENLKYLYDTLLSYILGTTVTTTTVTAAVASVDVQNIPQTGADIHITGYLEPATDDVGLGLRLNNRSGATDYGWQIAGAGSGVDASDSEFELVNFGAGALVAVGNAAGEYVWFDIKIIGYLDTTGNLSRSVVALVGWKNANGGVESQASMAGSMHFTEPVNRITLFFESGNIVAGVVRVKTTRAS
jgi:hypothetical protein